MRIQFFNGEDFFESPIIPAEFTQEERDKCKDAAIKEFLDANPTFSDKEMREHLDIMMKAKVVQILNKLFEREVKKMRKIKDEKDQGQDLHNEKKQKGADNK